jgi:two-component system sensor histidine kinase MprB
MTLRLRLTLLVAAVVAAGVVLSVFVSYRMTENQLLGEVDSFVHDRAHAIAASPGDLPSGQFPGNDGDGHPGPHPGGGGDQIVGLDAVTQLVAASGSVSRTLGGPALPVDAATKALAANGGPDHYSTVTVDGTPYRTIAVATPGGGAVQVARPLTETNNVLASLRRRLGLIGLSGILLAAALAWFVARRATRSLRALTRASQEVARTQRLDATVPVDGDAEVAGLGESMNAMLAALDTSRLQQRQLVQDAGHELRTPLTSVRANLEYLRRAKEVERSEHDQVLVEAIGEIDELSTLTDELVALATDEAAGEEPIACDLGELVEAAAELTGRRLSTPVSVQLDEPSTVVVRRNALEHVVTNLVANAAKFAGSANPVEITVDHGTVSVRDRGPGFDPADLPHVFDRFYRSDLARSLPGSGLGLAIVRHTVEGHGGTVTAANAPGGGAVVTFTLPSA